MRKPAILHVGKYYHPERGGIEDHLLNLCNAHETQYALHALVSNKTQKTVLDRVNGVKVTRVRKIGEVSNIPVCPSMPLWVMRLRADIVHLHLPNPMAHLAWFLARPKGRMVVTYHSDIIGRGLFMRFYTPFLMNLLRGASAVIAASPPMMRHSPFLSRLAGKITLIPYGISLSKFALTNDIQAETHAIRNRFGGRIVLFVGRLTYYKGLDYLVRAMEPVDGTLVIVGKGNAEQQFRQKAAASPAAKRIRFLGEVPDQELVAYFHACDVLVLPSVERSEAFGIVQLEAMACGKPVVSTDLPTGVPWVNQDGRTGIVVPPRDPGELARAIATLLDDPALRERYGRSGRERVEKEFTHELVAERVSSVYDHILGA